MPTPLAFLIGVVGGHPPGDLPEAPADRDRLLQLLHAHRLGGLAYSEARAEASPPGWLEDPVGETLREIHAHTGFHTTLVTEAGHRARAALTEASIPGVVFKGAALVGAGVYPDPGARGMGDVDLLIPPERATRAIRVLREVGFEPWVEWDEARLGWLPAFTFSDARAPAGMSVSLDLHWSTAYGRLRAAGPGPGPESTGPAGRSATTSDLLWDGADLERGLPAPEPHFVLLSEHFLRHLRVTTHMTGLADLVRSLSTVEDPQRLARHVSERGAGRGIRVLLALLRDGLGVDLPDSVLRGVGGVPPLSRTQRRTFDPARLLGTPDPAVEGRLEGLLLRWSILGSPTAVAGELWDVLAPPRTWLDLRYAQVPGPARRREHVRQVLGWLRGRNPSPLSPNQEFE